MAQTMATPPPTPEKPISFGRGCLIGVGIGLVVVIIAVIVGISGSSGGGSTEHLDPRFDLISSVPAWSTLSAECNETPEKLGSEVGFAYDHLEAEGLGENWGPLVHHLATAAGPVAPSDCSDIIAAYLVVRQGGQ